ncbi:N-glycosylase/DNA lyase [candidate division WOR-3 bacterium]|nr:N-glycosylase/DNA lyase [candidate division WOR-3 bacterium]
MKKIYCEIKSEIEKRFEDFRKIGAGTEEDVFRELCFCILTPQSNAKNCWRAVLELEKRDLILKGNSKEISEVLKLKTRFHNCKAENIVLARQLLKESRLSGILEIDDDFEMRIEIVKRVKGMGLKEASHFMRNTGRGENFAILDRHVLRFLEQLKVINEIPKNLTLKKYCEIEKLYIKYSKKISVPPAHLDMVVWYYSTGELFK